MKLLKYDEVEHRCGSCYGQASYTGTPQYAIDWSTSEERKFKEPTFGLRVYESGFVKLTHSFYGNPHARAFMRTNYGFDLRIRGEWSDLQFFHENGHKVFKKDIKNRVLLIDHELKRAYTLGVETSHSPNSAMVWLHDNAQPRPGVKVMVRPKNKERFKAYMDQLQPYLDFGTTLNALRDDPMRYYIGINWQHERMLLDWELPTTLQSEEARKFCQNLAAVTKQTLEKTIVQASCDKLDCEYLLVEGV